MMRFDRKEQWAATEFARATNPDHEPMGAPSSSFGMTEEARDSRFHTLTAAPRIVKQPQGLDYQGRYPEAAHAATHIGADTKDARKQMDEGAGAIVVPLVFGVAALVAVPLLWHLIASSWPRVSALLGL